MFYDDFIAPPGSGQPSFLVAQVVAGKIGPADSLVCTVRLDVSPGATGSFDLDFAVINGEVGTADTDTSNNGASVVLQFGSAESTTVSIPATGKPSVLLLLSALCMIGFLVLRWSQKQGDR